MIDQLTKIIAEKFTEEEAKPFYDFFKVYEGVKKKNSENDEQVAVLKTAISSHEGTISKQKDEIDKTKTVVSSFENKSRVCEEKLSLELSQKDKTKLEYEQYKSEMKKEIHDKMYEIKDLKKDLEHEKSQVALMKEVMKMVFVDEKPSEPSA